MEVMKKTLDEKIQDDNLSFHSAGSGNLLSETTLPFTTPPHVPVDNIQLAETIRRYESRLEDQTFHNHFMTNVDQHLEQHSPLKSSSESTGLNLSEIPRVTDSSPDGTISSKMSSQDLNHEEVIMNSNRHHDSPSNNEAFSREEPIYRQQEYDHHERAISNNVSAISNRIGFSDENKYYNYDNNNPTQEPLHHFSHPSNSIPDTPVHLYQRIVELEKQIELERAEAQLAREFHIQLQSELEIRTRDYENKLKTLWEKERNLIETARNEIESRVSRASLDNNNFHESVVKLLNDQHSRELSCVKEELTSEKKRYAELLEHEIKLREKAEYEEHQLRLRLESVEKQWKEHQHQNTQQFESHEQNRESWQREKKTIIESYETRLHGEIQAREDLESRRYIEVRNLREELSQQYELQLKSMEKIMKESLWKEFQAEKMLEFSKWQNQSSIDLEKLRQELGQRHALDIENLKTSFSDREKLFRSDFMELEKIQKQRIQRFEDQIQEWKMKNEELERKLRESNVQVQRIREESQKFVEVNENQRSDILEKCRQSHLEVKLAYQQIEEGKIREQHYREQLAEVLEENRQQRVELLEARRQIQNHQAHAHQWKSRVHDQDRHQVAADTALYIAQEEIALLERELSQSKKNQELLEKALHQAEKRIYGTKGNKNGILSEAVGLSVLLDRDSEDKKSVFKVYHVDGTPSGSSATVASSSILNTPRRKSTSLISSTPTGTKSAVKLNTPRTPLSKKI